MKLRSPNSPFLSLYLVFQLVGKSLLIWRPAIHHLIHIILQKCPVVNMKDEGQSFVSQKEDISVPSPCLNSFAMWNEKFGVRYMNDRTFHSPWISFLPVPLGTLPVILWKYALLGPSQGHHSFHILLSSEHLDGSLSPPPIPSLSTLSSWKSGAFIIVCSSDSVGCITFCLPLLEHWNLNDQWIEALHGRVLHVGCRP